MASIIALIIQFVRIVANLLVFLIILDALLSYFVSPYQPVRRVLNQIVGPLLNPIRRVVPPLGMFDLSPLILILLIQAVSYALTNLLSVL
jgi:YggT family protein